ncbi:MAG: hypothetical protein JO145_05765 [Acidobacteriaceae bacterium]|nr:hypothetical protein [Acidobacteriaceae bacterium]MBV9766441.1 hypothetical protein [Acidobacteriaceae bacterium]
MTQVNTDLKIPRQDVSLSRGDLGGASRSDPVLVNLDQLIHELRQPLGVIESLAYYLELTSSDEKVCRHLQRIQSMVVEANRILERECTPQSASPRDTC